MSKLIPVYRAEIEAGLDEKIRTCAFLAHLIKPTVDVNPNAELALKNPKIQLALAENKGQPDLFYLRDILVTASAASYNGNDDVFLPEEVYAARHTPEDKPFNLGHESTDIIGHITSQQLMAEDGTLIADDTVLDDLPSKFHVVNNTVIYKYWPEKARAEQIDQIIAEIEEGDKWYVSMEAIFGNFDYGIIDSSDQLDIVPRTKATAFLTKHLRAYGGKGTYKDNKIVRILRDFVFSGKGLVENPANPESVIESPSKMFFVKNSQLFDKHGYVLNSKQDKEKFSMNELEQAKAALAASEAAKAELEKQLKTINDKQYQVKLDELANVVKASEAKLTDLANQLKASQELADKVGKEKAEAEASLKEANDKLAKIDAEKVQAARIATITKELSANETQAKELNVTLAGLDDTNFKNFVAKAPKFVVAEVKQEEKVESKTKEDLAALEAAKAEKQVGAVDGEAEKNSKLQLAIAAITKGYNSNKRKQTVK